jgi:uncharacterized repeat protein (TIGR03806 family)
MIAISCRKYWILSSARVWGCVGLFGMLLGGGFAVPVKAEFLVVNRTTIAGGAVAEEVQGWPNVASFLAGGQPVTRYGGRPGSAEVSFRSVTTTPGGELLTLQAATGTDGTYDVYRWRDPYRFATNEGSFVITRYNLGKIIAITGDGTGRIVAVEETGGSSGARSYRVKRWNSLEAFSSYQVAEVVGTRANMPDLAGLEFVDGQLYGISPATVGGAAGYQVRRWADFAAFLSGSGTVMGSRVFDGTVVELFSEWHSAPLTQTGAARAPMWPWLGNKFPASTPGEVGGFSVVEAFPNLTFQNPVKMLPRPGAPGELWVIGREGHLWSFQNNPATATKTQVLNLTAATLGWGDSGLLGFAFHPEFGKAGSPNRGYVYVAYNFIPAGGDGGSGQSFNRLSRFTLADGATTISRASEYVLINQFDEHSWHNQGDLFFGADGFLYVGFGDEGGLNNEYGNAQRMNGGLFSGVVRIDVDQNPSRSHAIRRQPEPGGAVPDGWPATYTQGYFIPNDNPWQHTGGAVLEEFWAIGLRNPYRMSRDPVNGQVFIGDVGQTGAEEVNVLAKGANYQWAFREGVLTGPSGQPSPLTGSNTPPYWSYVHGDGNRCVIGGHVYRGAAHAQMLGGQYVFGDYVSGRLWAMRWEGLATPEVRQIASTTGNSLSGFGLDHNQELYLMSMGFTGRILKLSTTPAPQPPATLSATGAFSDLATLTPARGVLAFGVNAALWSDNAAKWRWIALPNNGLPYGADERVTFRADSEWDYPVGTVLIKHFELPVSDVNPAERKRLETRFTVKTRDGSWYGVTYKWRADGRDADLLAGGLEETVTIATAGGGPRTQTWSYPSRSDCLQCHNTASTQVLGLRTWQLNGLFTYPGSGAQVNQLQKWSDLGMFDQTLTPAQIAGFMKSSGLDDATASQEDRVRSYLDSNCAHCHRPGGAQAYFDARFNIPLEQQKILLGQLANSQGITGAHVVTPGSTDRSMLHRRLASLGAGQMPPVGKKVVDARAVALLASWINDQIAPAKPSLVAAVPAGYGLIQVTWTRGSTNEKSFRIERRKGTGTWQWRADAPAGAASFTDYEVEPATLYGYRIAAVNGTGASPWSDVAQATTWASPGSWQDWQRSYPLGGQNGPLQNPDGDSAANVVEFGLGTHPASGGSSQEERFRLSPGLTPGEYAATVSRPRGITGVTLTLMASAQLGRSMVWQPVTIQPTVSVSGETEQLTFPRIDQAPELAAAGQGFVRLRVRLTATGEEAFSSTWFWTRRRHVPGIRSFGPTMLRPERFSGRVTAGSNVLDVAASAGGWSVKNALAGLQPTYVEVVDGALAGHRFDIDSGATTATAIALQAGSPRNTLTPVPDLSGSRIVVRDHWTLGELFPPAKWQSSTSPTSADRVLFFNPAAGGWDSYWLAALASSTGGTWLRQGDASGAGREGVIVAPGAGLLVHRVGQPLEAVAYGVLRPNPFLLPGSTASALVAGGWPLDQSPAARAMLVSDGFTGDSNPALADRVLFWQPDSDPAVTAGYATHFLLNGGAGRQYWTAAGSAQLLNDNDAQLFRAHRAFFLRLRKAQPLWRLPLPWAP